jgi:hypothetical protein
MKARARALLKWRAISACCGSSEPAVRKAPSAPHRESQLQRALYHRVGIGTKRVPVRARPLNFSYSMIHPMDEIYAGRAQRQSADHSVQVRLAPMQGIADTPR